MSAALLLFAKAPEPGRVKTRLAASIGAELAAEAYACFLESTRLACESALRPSRRYLFVGGGASSAAFDGFRRPLWSVAPQPEGDLGARLEHAACAARSEGASELVFLGSDAPTLSGVQIDACYDALDRVDLAIGPSFDGGYYALATRAPTRALFEGMPWSTPAVLRATLERAAAAGYAAELLEYWYDIDTIEDARAALDHLEAYLAPRGGRGYSELALLLRKVVAASGRATL